MRAEAVPAVVQERVAPDAIRACTTFVEPDYVDVFTATARDAADRSAEQWARAALEGASRAGRFLIWQVILGLRLGPQPSEDHVAGWQIADRGDGWIRLEAASWFMTAHIVIRVEDDRVSAALFVRYDRAVGGAVWPPLSIVHRRLMPDLMRHAVRRIDRGR